MILEQAIARSGASGLADEGTKPCIRGALGEARREILRPEERSGDCAHRGFVLRGKDVAHACASARSECAADHDEPGNESDLLRDTRDWIEQGRWGYTAARSELQR